MTSHVATGRFRMLKRIALFCAMLLGLYIIFIGLLALLVQTDTLALVVNAGSSRWLLVVRLIVYASLWFSWKPLLQKYDSTLSDTSVRALRRPLIILIIAYEFLFGSEIPQLIGLLFKGS